jgi:hypothetical protein
MSGRGDIYDYAESDASGEITFALDPSMNDTLYVTSTAPDHLPYEGYSLIKEDISGISGKNRSAQTDFCVTNNPVLDACDFRFSLTVDSEVTISVFDVSGRKVRDVHKLRHGPGTHKIRWDTLTNDGTRAAPGIYVVTFKAGAFSAAGRIALIR